MNQEVEECDEATCIWDICGGRRRRWWRGGWRRSVVGEEAPGEKEREVGAGGSSARQHRWRRREEVVGVAVQVAEEAPHRAGGREGERSKPDPGGLCLGNRNGV